MAPRQCSIPRAGPKNQIDDGLIRVVAVASRAGRKLVAVRATHHSGACVHAWPTSGSEGTDMGRILRLAALAGVAVVAVKSLPDIQRYLKMRAM